MDLTQTWYDDRHYCTLQFDKSLIDLALHFDTSPIDLDLHSRSQECKKAKTSVPNISQSFQSM